MLKLEYNDLLFTRTASGVLLDGGVGSVEGGAVVTRNGQEVPDVIAKKVTSVEVDQEALHLAMERTGIDDPAELVAFAVGLLLAPDPSADFARAARGSMPGFDLDI
nr:hypothetical protein [uncultured Rhodopila sp.]